MSQTCADHAAGVIVFAQLAFTHNPTCSRNLSSPSPSSPSPLPPRNLPQHPPQLLPRRLLSAPASSVVSAPPRQPPDVAHRTLVYYPLFTISIHISRGDLPCVCTSAQFQTAAGQCLRDNCTSEEQSAALSLQSQQCAACAFHFPPFSLSHLMTSSPQSPLPQPRKPRPLLLLSQDPRQPRLPPQPHRAILQLLLPPRTRPRKPVPPKVLNSTPASLVRLF